MIDNCNINNLAKNLVSAIFFLALFTEVCYPNLPSFVWRRHVGAHPDRHQDGGRKPTGTSVTEFCYKSVNLSQEELKNNTVLLFFQCRNCLDNQIPRNKSRNKSLFNQLARHDNRPLS